MRVRARGGGIGWPPMRWMRRGPRPHEALPREQRRGLIAGLAAVGALVAWLVAQRTSLRAVVVDRDHQIDELRVIREALVPPDVPPREGLELATSFVAAEHSVSGDFYLVAGAPDDATVVVVGDAVGKGVEAARRAAFVRASLATFCMFTSNPARLLEMANHSLLERAEASDGAFVTAACVALRPGDGQIVWALAGHPPPLRMDDGEPLDGGRPGLPLGVELDLDVRADSGRLPDEGGLLLYTDGLIEARNTGAGDELDGTLGAERVGEVVRELRGATPGALVERLRAVAEEYSGGALGDDLCLVALRARKRGLKPHEALRVDPNWEPYLANGR